MKAKINRKEQILIVTPEGVEDLWHLDKIICEGVMVSGRSVRSYKPRPDATAEKKPVYIKLETEKTEFSKFGITLRVTGKIIEGSPQEFVQVGSYHTIEIKPNNTYKISKIITSSDVKRIKMAIEHSTKIQLGVVVIDDESAVFSKVMNYGTDNCGEVDSNTSKRDPNYSDNFIKYLSEVYKFVETSFPEGKIIIGGTGFTKDGLKKYLKQNDETILKRIMFVNTSVSGWAGVNEIIKNSLSSILQEHQLAEEANLLDKAMTHIGKDDNLCVYGIEKVNLALNYGAVEHLLVHEELIQRQDVQEILNKCDKSNTEYTLFSNESDSGRKLKGLSGLVVILRFKIE